MKFKEWGSLRLPPLLLQARASIFYVVRLRWCTSHSCLQLEGVGVGGGCAHEARKLEDIQCYKCTKNLLILLFCTSKRIDKDLLSKSMCMQYMHSSTCRCTGTGIFRSVICLRKADVKYWPISCRVSCDSYWAWQPIAYLVADWPVLCIRFLNTVARTWKTAVLKWDAQQMKRHSWCVFKWSK